MIRVMIVDDNAMTREGIKAFLSSYPDINVVAEAQDGSDAIEIFPKVLPDVVLMDLIMPKVDGIKATNSIMEKWPQARIIALTSSTDNKLIEKSIKAGAMSCLIKNGNGEKIIETIKKTIPGK